MYSETVNKYIIYYRSCNAKIYQYWDTGNDLRLTVFLRTLNETIDAI